MNKPLIEYRQKWEPPFILSSGLASAWRMNIEALSPAEMDALARIAIDDVLNSRHFYAVEGVPTGGIALAHAIYPLISGDERAPLLIVDDVCTTGNSLEKRRAGRHAKGLVIFNRGTLPEWAVAIWNFGGIISGDSKQR